MLFRHYSKSLNEVVWFMKHLIYKDHRVASLLTHRAWWESFIEASEAVFM